MPISLIEGAVYYDCDEGVEVLEHSDPDEAIAQALDNIGSLRDETITVYGFARKAKDCIDESDADRVLDQLLEWADEELGNPEDSTEPTSGMTAAAKIFVEAVMAEYEVWRCDRIGDPIVVNCEDWIKENRPEWLEEKTP